MNERKLFRFSKGVTVFCILANTAITVTLFVLMFRGTVLDGSVVIAIYAPFSIELGYNAMISLIEKKGKNDE